jgi:hypothetical protein
MATKRPLTARQVRFAAEYLIDLNATQAAIRAGYSRRSADVEGCRQLGNAKVAELIQKKMAKRAEKIEITADYVLARWAEIERADPHELSQFRRGPCDECWGGNDPEKGDEIDANCTGCRGEGLGRVFIPDTRKLTGAAKRLYAGVSVSKDGVKVLTRNQDEALTNMARHLGMFKDRIEHSGPDGKPIEMKIDGVDPIEAAREYARIMGNG